MLDPTWKKIVDIATLTLVTFTAVYFASEVGMTKNDVVALWPAAGLTLWGCWRYRWWGALSAFIAFYAYGVFFIEEFDNFIPSLGNTIAAVAGAAFLRRYFDPDEHHSLRNLTCILAAGCVLSAISAIVGGTHLAGYFQLNTADTMAMSMRWFLSDLAGLVITAPLCFTITQKNKPFKLSDYVGIELASAAALSVTLFFLLRLENINISVSAATLLLACPFVFWVMLRKQSIRVLTALSFTGLAALTLAAQMLNHDNPALLETQLFMLSFLTAALYIHELLQQVHKANLELEARQTTLEERVEERTHALLVAKQRAEIADKAKSEFLANTSHEVRTPLNGILGMAELLRQSELSLRQSQQLEVILSSGNHLLAILNDVIDLSKVEAGKFEIVPEVTNLHTLLSEIEDLWRPKAESKHLVLGFNKAAAESKHVLLDPLRLKQCLSNLLSNAIKFTEQGSVQVDVKLETQDDTHTIYFSIKDSGIGMKAEALDKLFTPFNQIDSSISRKFGGTGLGLAITRNLIELMDGQIGVSSKPGKGSVFEFHIRAEDAGPGTVQEEVSAENEDHENLDMLRGLRLLIVEDNPVNRMVAHGFLKPLELSITDAGNGQECLSQLAGATFDLILMDIHMPIMDGIEAIKQIRSSNEPWRNIPVIALTADAMSEDRERLMALGMSGYASKPIKKSALYDEMKAVISQAT